MADIIRIIIKGESGYGPVDEAFKDKVTIDLDSIRYEYKPVVESKINVPRKWSFKTSSPIFQKRFKEVADSVETILHWKERPFVTDIGATTFAVTYADKTKASRDFFQEMISKNALPLSSKWCRDANMCRLCSSHLMIILMTINKTGRLSSKW